MAAISDAQSANKELDPEHRERALYMRVSLEDSAKVIRRHVVVILSH